MNENSVIPQQVLSESLTEKINGRHIKAAVFTTFNFDPHFFELHVLPLLFAKDFSSDESIRLLQMENVLSELKLENHIEVYYDARNLIQTAEPPKLNYRTFDILMDRGVFHPKLILLLLNNSSRRSTGVAKSESLLVAYMSANLTRSGWWENLECVHIDEIQHNKNGQISVPYRTALMKFLNSIKNWSEKRQTSPAPDSQNKSESHSANRLIHTFLKKTLNYEELTPEMNNLRMFPEKTEGQKFIEWLGEIQLGDQDWNLEIISPYFDEKGCEPLKKLKDRIDPIKTRVYLPIANKECQVTADAYDAVQAVQGVEWAKLPDKFASRSGGGDDRRVHAKVFRIWHEDGGEYILAGSVNCTTAAYSKNKEAAILVNNSEQGVRKSWWLEELSSQKMKLSFAKDNSGTEADKTNPTFLDVSILFNWETETLSYRANSKRRKKFGVCDRKGKKLFEINKVDGEWHRKYFNQSLIDTIKVSLVEIGSFFEVRYKKYKEEASWIVLVREEGTQMKPSTTAVQLSPARILEIWSSLSAEDREFVIERQGDFTVSSDLDGPRNSSHSRMKEDDSVFSRFYGVFHAFEQTRKFIDENIKKDELDSVEVRLFGKKFDSLSTLLEQISNPHDSETIVVDYTIYLSAKQLFNWLECTHSKFYKKNKKRIEPVLCLMEKELNCRKNFLEKSEEISGRFLNWYEEMFLKDFKDTVDSKE